MLLGTNEFIVKARRYRKALGGGMRQIGFLAAAGLVALDQIVPLLGKDHKRARDIAVAINNLKSSVFTVDLKNLHTNILMINVKSSKITALDLSNRFARITDKEVEDGIVDDKGLGLVVTSSCKNLYTLRLVLYTQITDEENELAIKKVIYVLKELEKSL